MALTMIITHEPSNDYYALEGLMWRINAKVRSESFNLGGSGRVSRAFREVFCSFEP
jgi:hypothetical protein